MSDLSETRIAPAGPGIERLDFLIGDLRDMQRDLEHDGRTFVNRAQAIEANLLLLLDSISPETRRAIAERERYLAAMREGACR